MALPAPTTATNMKTASLKISNGNAIIPGRDLYREYTGDDLYQRLGNAPVGFYRNVNESYKGLVFRDINANCTYFDITHGMVYAFDHEIWKDTIFRFVPEMKSLSIAFPTEKKMKKKVDVAAR